MTATVYQVRAIIAQTLAARDEKPAYNNRSAIATDANGDFTGYIPKGGMWNLEARVYERTNKKTGKVTIVRTEDNTSRILGGVTKSDVDACRADLAAIGYKASWDDVDAMLCQGAYGEEVQVTGLEEVVFFTPLRRAIMTNAERKKRQRLRARAEGLCSTCLRDKAREGLATCHPCNEASKGRVYASRGKVYAA